MYYEQFKSIILTHLKEKFPESMYTINIRKVTKNNGLKLDGLCIFRMGEDVSPTIYLNAYYDQYVRGTILTEIIRQIISEYEQGMIQKPDFDCNQSYYEAVNHQVILRLVNYEKNKEILEDCPYLSYFDLAITFRWLAHWDEIGISTALISKKELERWGIEIEQLYEDALSNTKRIFPARIVSLREMLEGTDSENLDLENKDLELFVLTNTQGINGATAVLYRDIICDFAHSLEANLYLLPSSIHEMMICPENSKVSEEMLLSLVKEANHMVVTMGEVLSDNIYYYDYKKEEMRLIEQPDSYYFNS